MRFFLLMLLVVGGGCAKYEFDIVEPADLAKHIGRNEETVLKRDELEYRFLAVEGRLLMYVANPTEEQIELIGAESTAVDPRGQSHPFRGQAIAPHSFIKVILPPMRPYYRSGPSFGIGIGVHAYRGYPGRYWPGVYDPVWDGPRYFTVVDEADTIYWTWEDEGEARFRLTFKRGREIFHHNFGFKRKKV